MLRAAIAVDNPFVGLRSFEPSESLLFHGRKKHTQQLLRVLAEHRFLGVIGTSGSGKSSLVKAGLLPALHRGYLRGASSNWRSGVMRPGSAPLQRLAETLHDPKAFGLTAPVEKIAARLEENSAALVDLLREQGAPENLLLVVDQFEEIFRLKDDGARQASYFVGLLLRCQDELDVPIFVVLTMRSEYLGECAQHPGLAEALSEAQYLIPRLTREEREEAIRGPLDMVGCEIDDGLVQRLLNDAGTDPNQLPALQHALMKLFEATLRGERLAEDRYVERLRVGRSLNYHAQEIYHSLLPASQKKLVKKIFRCLTTTEDGIEVRRPKKISELCAITGAVTEEVSEVVNAFSQKKDSLLFVGPDGEVDITHESLIQQWEKLREWVKSEAESAEWFSRLVRSTELGAGLWGKRDVEFVSERIKEEGWNQPWGDQYKKGFGEAMDFLRRSRAEVEAAEERSRQQLRELDAARERELRSARTARRWLKFALYLASMVISLFVALFWTQRDVLLPPFKNRWTELWIEARVNQKDGLRYVHIPAGKFMMGCSPGDTQCSDDENPAHEVEITEGFWMGQTEVTQAAYQNVTKKDNPSYSKGVDRPVAQVDWNDAKSYCEAVGMRLPTEAEWEYAARAGSTQATYGELSQVAWFDGNSGGETHPAGKKLANAWGLYDMLGNVWEWTADWYDPKYYEQKVSKDPPGPAEGRARVVRGGSWNYISWLVRASNRSRSEPTLRSNNLGFRCAGELR